jgi:hypothetical protein
MTPQRMVSLHALTIVLCALIAEVEYPSRVLCCLPLSMSLYDHVCAVQTHVTGICAHGSAHSDTCKNRDTSNELCTLLEGQDIQRWSRFDVDSTLQNAGFRLVRSAIIEVPKSVAKRYSDIALAVF